MTSQHTHHLVLSCTLAHQSVRCRTHPLWAAESFHRPERDPPCCNSDCPWAGTALGHVDSAKGVLLDLQKKFPDARFIAPALEALTKP